jgi:hypothetical protein
MGGLSELMYADSLGQGYVIMINSGDGAAIGRIAAAVKDYLLRNVKAPQVEPAALPDRYKAIDGYYQPINFRSEGMGLMISVLGITKVTHDDKQLHRSPLMPSWTSSDYVGAREVLVDRWSGLPSIAIVEDPLVGPALQTGSEILMRIPAWKVFARLSTLAMLIAMSIGGFVALIVWAARRARKKTTDARLWLRLWPLAASAALVVYLVGFAVAGLFLESLGDVTPVSVALFILSLVYPAVVLSGAAYLLTTKARQPLNAPYWFAAAFAVVHLLAAGYMAMYEAFAIRTWV